MSRRELCKRCSGVMARVPECYDRDGLRRGYCCTKCRTRYGSYAHGLGELDRADYPSSRDWPAHRIAEEAAEFHDDAVARGYALVGTSAIELAFGIERDMAKAGYHMKLTSPFAPGEPYWAGFTLHGTTGFNGRPDFRACAVTPALAIALAALQWVHSKEVGA